MANHRLGFSILSFLIGLILNAACAPIASNVPKRLANAQNPQASNDDTQKSTPAPAEKPAHIRIMNFQTRLVSASADPIVQRPAIDLALKPEQIRDFLADGILRLKEERGQNALSELEKTEIGEIEVMLSLRPEQIVKETTGEREPLNGLRIFLKYEPENAEAQTLALADTTLSSPWVLVLARRHSDGLLTRLRAVLKGIRIKAAPTETN